MAEANAPLPAANPVSTAAGGIAPTANTGNANGTNATGGGFQIQELAIKFTGVQEMLNQSSANGQAGNTGVQLSAFRLQIEEVNLTLTNGHGQTAQIQAAPAPTEPTLQAEAATA